VLLDRDGTLTVEKDYVLDSNEVKLNPGVLDGLRQLQALGLGMIVVTNQSPVGRGLLTLDRLEEIHDRLRALLAEGGIVLDDIYVCPHGPDDGCDCRKPRPGMALRAAADHRFDLARAFVVGDHARDLQMGRRVGAATILVRTGHGEDELANGAADLADHVAADLGEVAEIIRDAVLGEAGA
jgi:D-glycero-D-manno-heptose 1,7-bisphosphate phosphatase